MLQNHNFILPTLNFEPYHHKPPVLFWLINLMWAIFGVSQQSAMIVPYLAGFATLMLTARLSKRLFPDNQNAPLLSVAILGGLFPFVVYTNLIMFDLLLSVFVMIGITAIWDFFKTGKTIHLLTLSIAIGLGAITKGPVILLHLAPAIFLVKIWMDKATLPPLKSTAPKFAGALLLGVLIGLCWAIPAAIEGGKEFAEKIFYGQTAGRMVNAFDHKRPVFWYFMFVPLFFMPWVFSPAFWSGTKAAWNNAAQKKIVQFLLCWAIPVFAAFCFISGKQVHYLLPLMPPIALLICAAFLSLKKPFRKRDFLPILLGAILLTLIPVLAHFLAAKIAASMPNSVHIEDGFSSIWITPPLVLSALIAILGLILCRTKEVKKIMVATAISMALMMVSFQISAKSAFFKNYDLTPIGNEIAKDPSRPVAFLGGYNGEFSFLGKIDKPIEIIKGKKPPKEWFKTHPNGLAVVFTRTPDNFKGYTILQSIPYKMTNTYLVIEQKK
jgi:4-amino-4-deoxy-L-arabinose transferase-like glycosyltransferase